ncbi:MAG: hypothetical protein J0I32_24145 [Sphingobacteriales bacterium]|nr:hypothetical protein [Sphingobacteriales bacterium]OJW01293.1 MAG: hypothetical protein BGO52_07620 [Sphingobacteriales bacterium 44-61]
MNREHVISDELIEVAQISFAKGENWIAYNTIPYFLDTGDMYFFKTADEAHGFSDNNISEYDNYRVLHAYSTDELLRRFFYGENLERLFADPDANGLYNTEGNAFTDALIDHIEQQQILNNKNVSIMNEQNFDHLKDNIKYMGFGEKQHDELEAHLKEGKEAFQMTYSTEINKKAFEAVLQFRKSEKSDMYFLNSYKASLDWSNGEKKEQTFYLNYGRGVTAKEAFNLLSGRSVEKELLRKLSPEETTQFKAELKLPPEQRGLAENWEKSPTYKAWIQLDFENKDKNNNYEVKQYHENYGYDLKAAVGKYFVMEMDGGEKEKALLQSLQKGNIQAVNIQVDGEAQKMFIEANPQYKTINLYDDKMQRLNQEQRQHVSQKQSGEELKQGKEVKEDQKQEVKQDKKKSVKQSPLDDLGKPKKGRSRKKGMSV